MAEGCEWVYVGGEGLRGALITLGFALGLSCSSFLAAASMDAAAPKSSFSAMTVGSSGSTHSDPAKCNGRHRLVNEFFVEVELTHNKKLNKMCFNSCSKILN